MAQGVVWNLLCQLIDEIRPFRAGPHKAHLSFEHIDDLRQLVNPQLSYNPPDPGSAVVIHLSPARCPIVLGLVFHATQFVQRENTSILTAALLPIKHRAAAFNKNAKGSNEQDR